MHLEPLLRMRVDLGNRYPIGLIPKGRRNVWQLGGGTVLPTEGCAFISVKDDDKPWALEAARVVAEKLRVLLQRTPWSAGSPARRLSTVMRSATMKPE